MRLMRRRTKMTSTDALTDWFGYLVRSRWRNLWEAPALVLVGIELCTKVRLYSKVAAGILLVVVVIASVGMLWQAVEGWFIWVRRRKSEEAGPHGPA